MDFSEEATEQRAKVFLLFGYAACAAQQFEMQLKMLLIGFKRVENTAITQSGLDETGHWVSKKAMFRLIGELKKRTTVTPDTEELFHRCRNNRNHLMHHFFIENIKDMLRSRAGCEKAQAELVLLKKEFSEADVAVEAIRQQICKALGWSEAWIKQEIQKRMRRLDED